MGFSLYGFPSSEKTRIARRRLAHGVIVVVLFIWPYAMFAIFLPVQLEESRGRTDQAQAMTLDHYYNWPGIAPAYASGPFPPSTR